MGLIEQAVDYEPAMIKYIRSQVPVEEVEDILQDTYEGIIKAHFKGRCKPTTWFHSIMRRKVVDYHRYHRKIPSTLPYRKSVNPDFDYLLVEDAVKRLPEKYRDVAELLLTGMSLSEVAAALGETYECVRSRYRAAEKVLRRLD